MPDSTEWRVGIAETTAGPLVAVDLGDGDELRMDAAFAYRFAQALLRNARLAGCSEPFVELPLHPSAPH